MLEGKTNMAIGDDPKVRLDRLLTDYRKLEEEIAQNRKCIHQLVFGDVANAVELRIPDGIETDGLPLPPASLRYLVAGTDNIPWFLHAGRLAAQTLVDTLASVGVRWETIGSALDFGCGCGRVIRHLSSPTIALHGTDANAFAIGWCQNHLTFGSFIVGGPPPLPHAASSLDLVYAFSVFTHMPEDMQLAWVSEFRRVLKPGGFLLFSVHGETFLKEHPLLSASEQTSFSRGHLVVQGLEYAETNFCNAFHPEIYVRSVLSSGSRVLAFIPGGAKGNPPQDVYLLQRV